MVVVVVDKRPHVGDANDRGSRAWSNMCYLLAIYSIPHLCATSTKRMLSAVPL